MRERDTHFAEKLGKSQSFISKYERGERRLDFTEFIELAEILEIDIADFVSRYQSAITQITFQKVRRSKKNQIMQLAIMIAIRLIPRCYFQQQHTLHRQHQTQQEKSHPSHHLR